MSSMKIELSTIGRMHVQWDDMGQHHTVRIALAPDYLATLAAANGYVKVGEELAAMNFAIIYALSDCTDFEGNPASEINYLQCIRKLVQSKNGYQKVGDDEIVVKRGTLNALIDDHCADCAFDSLEIHDCDNCDLKPIRDRLKSEEGK